MEHSNDEGALNTSEADRSAAAPPPETFTIGERRWIEEAVQCLLEGDVVIVGANRRRLFVSGASFGRRQVVWPELLRRLRRAGVIDAAQARRLKDATS